MQLSSDDDSLDDLDRLHEAMRCYSARVVQHMSMRLPASDELEGSARLVIEAASRKALHAEDIVKTFRAAWIEAVDRSASMRLERERAYIAALGLLLERYFAPHDADAAEPPGGSPNRPG